MSGTIAQKLKIKEGNHLFTVNAPDYFKKRIEPLPPGVELSNSGTTFDQVHWFVVDRSQMEREMKSVLRVIDSQVVCWIYFPKGSSKMQTDLTRDRGWDTLISQGFRQVSLISFDETWSAFAFRLRSQIGKNKVDHPKEREIFKYIDTDKKIVTIPADLLTALETNKKAMEFFERLPFSHRKEYVEWIISAKRAETRTNRIAGTIQRLLKGWKNPANN